MWAGRRRPGRDAAQVGESPHAYGPGREAAVRGSPLGYGPAGIGRERGGG